MSTYQTFLPNYYGSLIRGQQNATIIDNMYWYVADGVSTSAQSNTASKTTADEQQVINQVLYGGRVLPNNLLPMIRNIPWEEGKIFAAYDSHDPTISGKDTYCITSGLIIYKCLNNNNNSPSLFEPSTIDPGSQTLADGYIWQYMYRLYPTQIVDFSIAGYIPVIEDPIVTSSAIPGTVTSIEVEDGGLYPFTNSGRVQEVYANNIIKIEDAASNISDIYNEMGFTVTSGPGAGQTREITGYTANTSGRYATLSESISGIDITSLYSIAPYVKITGNGENATARSIVTNGVVTSIEILNSGINYTLSKAELRASESDAITSGRLRVNLSPPRGHGADILQELYADTILIDVNMDNYTIPNSLPTDEITFCRTGLMRYLSDNETGAPFTDRVFSNTLIANVPQIDSQFQVGDIIKYVGSDNPTAEVVYANNTHICAVYHNQLERFSANTTIESESGVIGNIVNIIQPQIRMIDTDIVAIVNTNTIQRADNSRENLQILIKIR